MKNNSRKFVEALVIALIFSFYLLAFTLGWKLYHVFTEVLANLISLWYHT